MPQVSIYIRDEDYSKWAAIEKKAEFIHNALNGVNIHFDNPDTEVTISDITVPVKPIKTFSPSPKEQAMLDEMEKIGLEKIKVEKELKSLTTTKPIKTPKQKKSLKQLKKMVENNPAIEKGLNEAGYGFDMGVLEEVLNSDPKQRPIGVDATGKIVTASLKVIKQPQDIPPLQRDDPEWGGPIWKKGKK